MLAVTGGGAFKFNDLLSSRLGVHVLKSDEMLCAMTGLSFLSGQVLYLYRFCSFINSVCLFISHPKFMRMIFSRPKGALKI